MAQEVPDHAPVVFIGGGTMARAIIHGAVGAKVLDPRRIAVVEPVDERRLAFGPWVGFLSPGVDGAMAWLARAERAPGEGQILLAVKPQSFPLAAGELCPALAGISRVVISIMAGTPSERVRGRLGGNARVVRVMPNMAAQIGKGMTAISRGAGSLPGDERLAERIFAGAGKVVQISESMMDAFTALAGSGPAYVFYLAEAMLGAALDMGFEPPDALEIVRETIAGAGLLLAGSTSEPAGLRDAVTSKGGTTAAASEVLDGAGVGAAVRRAIIAARDRGAELARG